MNDWQTELGRALLVEGLSLTLGAQIGNGIDRWVYRHRGNDDWIVKIEPDTNHRFQNVAEWHLWENVRETSMRGWLAPCVRISHSGNFLIMERTTPVLPRDLPKRIPAWLTDVKASNWGRLPNGRVVCHDYGFNLAASNGLSKRLVKVKWDV